MLRTKFYKILSLLLLVLLLQGCIQTLDSLSLSPEITFKVELGELQPDKIAQAVVGNFSYTLNDVPSDKTLGITKLQLTVFDGNGSSANISIPIEIINTKSPTLSLRGEAVIYLPTNTVWRDPGVNMLDPINGTTVFTYELLKQSGFIQGNINLNLPGEYIFSYQTKDALGNVSNTITRRIIVQDLEGPTIQFTPNIVLFEGVPITLQDIEVNDNIDSLTIDDLTIMWDGLNQSNPQVGVYNVVFSVTDSSNNSSVRSRTYNIIYPIDRLFTVLNHLADTSQISQLKRLMDEYQQYPQIDQTQFLQLRLQFIKTYEQQYLKQYNQYKDNDDIFRAMAYLKEMSVFFEPNFVTNEIYRLVATQVSTYQSARQWEDALSLVDDYKTEITENQYRNLVRQTISFMSNATTESNNQLHRRLLNRYADVIGGRQNINYIVNSAKISELVFLEKWVSPNYNAATMTLIIDRELGYISEKDADKLVQDSMIRNINQLFDATISEAVILAFAQDIEYDFVTLNNNWYESYIANLFKD